ncbi:MAG: hypothetical protein GXP31_05305 [Kiritimatiellaeota bacterium]|nr:hypothetical protein [Kiritimatiellota bacterium]
MHEFTTAERIERMFQHRPADRVPIIEHPWGATLERWRAEGLPDGVDFVEFLDLDRIAGIGVDNSPRFPARVVEETDEYVIRISTWGATSKQWKHQASTPEFLDFAVKTPDDWRTAKERMQPSDDRIPWQVLRDNYTTWRDQGRWVLAHGWFGFDVTHSWFIGTEQLLVALVEHPDWCADMFRTELELDLALLDRVWDAGYRYDALVWPDDMGFKFNQFFSLDMYRELLKPIHRRAIEWAHAKGIHACLHSCGNINPFVPELLELGLEYLNPIEVKAGMDPFQLKRDHGERLVLHGGVSALLWEGDIEVMAEHLRTFLPVMMKDGGYIFATDHSVPSSVSLAEFRRIVDLVKEVGAY